MAARQWKDVVLSALKREQVIGDVLKAGWLPTVELKVSFPTAQYDVQQMGLSLTPSETAMQPTLEWDADSDKLYSLLMVDPDPPSRQDPKYKFWRHWIRVNVPGNTVGLGRDISPYIGPGPPPQTGLHRYVFLVYQQQEEIKDGFWDNSDMTGASFDYEAWTKEKNLGDPLGAWYFQAEHESNKKN